MERNELKKIFGAIFEEFIELNRLLKFGQSLFLYRKNEEVKEGVEKAFKIIKQEFPLRLHNVLFYLIGELTDNISQHSHCLSGVLVLSFDKKSGVGEIVVVDDGVSIPGAFEKRKIGFKDDLDSVDMAISGKSTKKEKGRGFGLSSSRRLVEEGLKGDFMVVSGKGVYRIKGKSSLLSKPFCGTLVYVRFEDSAKGLNIYEYLE